MSALFIVHTPYHIFLSCGIASLEPLAEKKYLIIIIEEIEQISNYKQIITSWEKNPFSKIYLLNDLFHIHTKKNDLFYKILLLINLPFNKIKIKYIFRKKAASELFKAYVFADHNVNSQFFAKTCSEKKGRAIYVEDGSVVYANNLMAKPSTSMILFYKFFYGFWYTPLEVQGTSKYVDTLMVAYPEFLRPELKSKKYVQIPEKAYSFLKDSLSPYLNETFKINTENLDYIIILPYSLFLRDKDEFGIINMYKMIIENLIVNNKIGLKYHPREKTSYLNLKPNPNLSLIPKTIPLEIVWMSLKENQLKAVIGDISTALITSRKMLGCNIKIISLGQLMNINKESYVYLKKFGIFIPDSFDKLMLCLGE